MNKFPGEIKVNKNELIKPPKEMLLSIVKCIKFSSKLSPNRHDQENKTFATDSLYNGLKANKKEELNGS